MNKFKCIHFTGLHDTHCVAGVAYRTFLADGKYGPEEAAVKPIPCLSGKGECERREFMTDAEFQARQDEIARTIKQADIVAEKIRGTFKRGDRGEIECPNCGGNVSFSISIYNGHIIAACEKEDCIRFME